MRARPVRWPWLGFALFLATAGVALALVVRNRESLAEQIPFVIAFAMFGVVGALILSRARNRVGALLLYGSAVTAFGFLGGEVATAMYLAGTRDGLGIEVIAMLSDLGWIVGILPVLLFLPLLFPDGRLLSSRWRPLAWTCIGTLVFLVVGGLFSEPTWSGSVERVQVPNPLYVPALGRVSIPDVLINVLLLVCIAGGVGSLAVRYRRAGGIERQQMKWVAASLILVTLSLITSIVLTALGGNDLLDTIVTGTAFLSIPVSIGISVLQFRLYELDVVVKKALIAGTLAVIVIGVYAALVGVFGTFASGRESSVTLFVIALALGIAFRPVTRFARKVADRFVYGRRATPYEVLTEFSERVGDAYATHDVLARMAQILAQGVAATEARVWLLVGRELREASAWPADAGEAPPIDVAELTDGASAGRSGRVVVAVRDAGELLGALSVTMPSNDPMTPAKEKLVRDLASQAGLALRNVRLVEDLKASQRRIVAAQDAERRRIERNIHDGAQQQLVALTVKMRLAQSLATRDADKTAEMLEQMQVETQTALEDLRDLARGVYPPLLADKGLPAAIEAQVRKAGLEVELEPDGVGRYPQEVESAVYFSVLEALQNVAKYAAATHVAVRLRGERDGVTFAVEDDGRGFDPAATGYGTGLQGIADRLSALGGEMQARSAPGEGTVVRGRIPVSVQPRAAAEGVAPDGLEPARSALASRVS
jgi:signal transduction histidine kinase